MPFDPLSFAALFHADVRTTKPDLLVHLLVTNALRPYAERALLARTLLAHAPDALPAVDDAELQDCWDDLMVRLNCLTEARAERFLADLGLTVEDVTEALERHLRVQKLVDGFVAGLATRPADQDAVLWELFADGSLRGHVVRAAAQELLARDQPAPATAEELAAARAHVAARHGAADWAAVAPRLAAVGAAAAVEAYLERHARARRGPA